MTPHRRIPTQYMWVGYVRRVVHPLICRRFLQCQQLKHFCHLLPRAIQLQYQPVYLPACVGVLQLLVEGAVNDRVGGRASRLGKLFVAGSRPRFPQPWFAWDFLKVSDFLRPTVPFHVFPIALVTCGLQLLQSCNSHNPCISTERSPAASSGLYTRGGGHT